MDCNQSKLVEASEAEVEEEEPRDMDLEEASMVVVKDGQLVVEEPAVVQPDILDWVDPVTTSELLETNKVAETHHGKNAAPNFFVVVFENNDLVKNILSFLVPGDRFFPPPCFPPCWQEGQEAQEARPELFRGFSPVIHTSKQLRQAFLQALQSVDFKFVWGLLGGDPLELQFQFLQWIKRHNLKIVHLVVNPFPDPDKLDYDFNRNLQAFTEIKIWSNLTTLQIDPTDMIRELYDAADLQQLYRLFAQATRLENLDLYAQSPYDIDICGDLIPHATYQSLLALNTLKTLSIKSNHLQDALSDIEQLPSLETLEICECEGGPRPFSVTSKSLKVLVFSFSREFSDFYEVGDLEINCPSLNELCFTCSELSKIGGTPTNMLLANATATDEESLWDIVRKGQLFWTQNTGFCQDSGWLGYYNKDLIVTSPLDEATVRTLRRPDAIRVGTNCRIVSFLSKTVFRDMKLRMEE